MRFITQNRFERIRRLHMASICGRRMRSSPFCMMELGALITIPMHLIQLMLVDFRLEHCTKSNAFNSAMKVFEGSQTYSLNGRWSTICSSHSHKLYATKMDAFNGIPMGFQWSYVDVEVLHNVSRSFVQCNFCSTLVIAFNGRWMRSIPIHCLSTPREPLRAYALPFHGTPINANNVCFSFSLAIRIHVVSIQFSNTFSSSSSSVIYFSFHQFNCLLKLRSSTIQQRHTMPNRRSKNTSNMFYSLQ